MKNRPLSAGIYLLLLSTIIFSESKSQTYAPRGNGLYKPHIFWLNWKDATPARTWGSLITNGTYTWSFNNGYEVSALVSNVTAGNEPVAYNSSDFSGDMLPHLYNVDNVTPTAPFLLNTIGMRTNDWGETTSFSVTLSVTLNGNAVPFPGIVFADAENTGESVTQSEIERVICMLNDGMGWRLIDRTIVADLNYIVNVSGGGQNLDITMQPTGADVNSTATGVFFAQDATSVNIILNPVSSGLQAAAVGLVLPFDYGDAPQANYRRVAHQQQVQVSGTDLADGTYVITSMPMETLSTLHPLRIGTTTDVEIPFTTLGPGTTAVADDADGTDDEDGVGAFPVLAQSATSYSVDVSVSNTSGSAATLFGWIDFNNNGTFDPTERTSANVPDGHSGAITLTWNPITVTGPGGTSVTFARFRLANADVNAAQGAAAGEVEDYMFSIPPLPVVLEYFRATLAGERLAELSWKISTAENFSHFEVEYGSSISSFSTIAKIPYTGPNQKYFSYQHVLPGSGIWYYRLKMVDKDGTFSYSGYTQVRIAGNGVITVGPNPVINELKINGLTAANEVLLYDNGGRLLHHQKAAGAGLSVNTSGLAKGIYIVRVKDNNTGAIVLTEKIIKQ
ncbi:MAG TPA: CshA/CshB family fibrillar adhesin-related protein [Chitinophagaceae bacterium]|nr:CshA/CshB family fibrillar adhesin-related protein [Chitinophagaceae bacterium]